MTTSYTTTTAFTVTHARNMASKVATDLKRIQRYYGEPSDDRIREFEEELIELLRYGYLGTVKYGYKRDGQWIVPTVGYTSVDLAGLGSDDDDPGKIRAGADISGAVFYSYLTYSAKWDGLTSEQKSSFKNNLPFVRGGASEPGVNGYFVPDKTYSSGGQALGRSSVRSY